MADLFHQKGKKLFFDRRDLEEIAKQVGTPVYVFSSKKLKENISHLKKIFTKYLPKTQIAYSMKNNSLEDIVSDISSEIDLFETSSIAEVNLLNKIMNNTGKPLNLISTNIYKSDEQIETVHNYPTSSKNKDKSAGITKIFAIDSYQDLLNIERMSKQLNTKSDVLVRVNPGIKMDVNEAVFASAYLAAKCASIIADIKPIMELSNDPTISLWLPERNCEATNDTAEFLIKQAAESKYLELKGIHCHLGSQITNLEYFDRFFEVITKFYKLMVDKGFNLQYLDLGGGYPVDYSGRGCVPSIEAIANSLKKNIQAAGISPKIIIESGRYITASAGILLSEVKLTKRMPRGRNLAVMDFSVYSDLLDVLIANWFFESLLVTNLPSEAAHQVSNWDLVGETNDALDKLTPRINIDPEEPKISSRRIFPRNLEVGDLIAIKNAGAYTECFNSNYCGREFPKFYLIQ